MKLTSYVITGAFTLALSLFSAETNGGSRSGESVVMLEIDGKKITMADIERMNPTAFFQARNSFHDAQKKVVEAFVEGYLMEEQAKKEGLTGEQMFDKYVKAKLPPDPSEEAVRIYFEGVDTKESYEAIRPKIVDSLRSRRMAKLKAEYIQTVRDNANVRFNVGPPRANISLKNTPVRGPVNAPIVMVEYADYECPYCQQIQPVLEKLEAEYKGKMAFAYKDMPLPMHANAPKAAEATHCADAQGKYWEMHDHISKTKQLDMASLKDAARILNLDAAAYNKCLDSGEKADIVKSMAAEAAALGVQGTPTFVLNGRYFSGTPDYAQLKAVIDEELAMISQQSAKR